MKSFQETQFLFTSYLRDPENRDAPALSPDRLQVYVELIYNNIENFLASGFPVCRSIVPDDEWHTLVRDFIRDHSAQTPYFLEISQEFLSYLLQVSHPLLARYPFFTALAHYEWVELALDIADEEPLDQSAFSQDLWASTIRLSPLSMLLTYPWAVHKISSDNIPQEQKETHLLVYRNKEDWVKFIELSAVASRFLQLCRDNQLTVAQYLALMVSEGCDEKMLKSQLPPLINQLYSLELVALAPGS